MEKGCGWYNYLYSVSYLTLTAGDKGIKCPSVSPKQCKQGPSGVPPLATMAILSAPLATVHRWLHSLSPRAPEKAPGRHVGGCAGARVQGGNFAAASALPRSLSCRVRKLVVHWVVVLSCRSKFLEMPWLAFPASSSCRGLVSLA